MYILAKPLWRVGNINQRIDPGQASGPSSGAAPNHSSAPFVAAGWEKIILKRSIFDLTAACHRHATHDARESEPEAVRFTQSTEEKKFQVVSTCCTLSEGVAQEHGLRPFAPPAK